MPAERRRTAITASNLLTLASCVFLGGEKQGSLRCNVANVPYLASLVASHSSSAPDRKEVPRRLELKPDEALIQSLFSAQTCTLSVAQRCEPSLSPWD